jgi:hypothetical protein
MKIPTKEGEGVTPFIEQRTQLLHDFGAFLALWSEFEMSLEIAIARRVGMSTIHASIVLGGLSFGAKPFILYSLIEEAKEDPSIASKVRMVIDHARRNALVHGFTNAERGEETVFSFSKREVKNGYRVTHAEFTADGFTDHFQIAQRLVAIAWAALDITNDDLNRYGREARLFAPIPKRPQAPPQNEETNEA